MASLKKTIASLTATGARLSLSVEHRPTGRYLRIVAEAGESSAVRRMLLRDLDALEHAPCDLLDVDAAELVSEVNR